MIEIYGVPNTWRVCLYIIIQKGFNVSILSKVEYPNGKFETMYSAQKHNHKFIANDYLSLLGVIRTWEILGDNLISMKEEGKKLAAEIPQDTYYFEEDEE